MLLTSRSERVFCNKSISNLQHHQGFLNMKKHVITNNRTIWGTFKCEYLY